ncbi:MAG: trypsin-like peptidase domain-containing protein [Ignavibacteriales bacterium]|nr:trypsin-like peptidase domain-containing protein [Ignavibacteriales bacterium]
MSTKSVLAAVFLISLGIIFGVVLVSSFKGVDFSFAGEDVKLGAQQAPIKPNSTLQALNDAFHDVGKTMTPSVVYVQVEMSGESEPDSQQDPGQFFHRFFGPDFKFEMPKRGPEVGAGSGVIITSNGYILTNNHVVANAKKNGIKVQLSDTREFKAKLIGTDKYTDLAVIKIEADNLPAAALGNSDDVEVGHIVFAIGAPLGLKSTMTQGIVSALGRTIGINQQDGYGIENFIQTDAAVNPGNSGGPLVNINGEVVGINTAIATTNARYQGYSFAIPLNLAKRVATDIIKFGKFRRGFLGVQIKDVDAVYAKAAGLDKKKGVWVESVTKDAAGDKAGLEDGDIILSVDGKEVNSVQTLQTAIATKHPGEDVTLQIWRNKKQITKKVTLGSRDEKDEAVAENANSEKDEVESDVELEKSIDVKEIGVTVKAIDTKIKKRYEVEKGVLVSDIEDLSPAQERGLRKGDIVTDIGDQKISTPDQFEKSIKKLKAGDAVMLRVKGEDKKMRFVPIEMPK